MKLPRFITTDQALSLLQSKWAALIEPPLSLPQSNSLLLQSVSLTSGPNVVNHKLGRALQGWSVVRMRGSFVQVYDTQDSNPTPSLTLALNASGPCVVDLEVF